MLFECSVFELAQDLLIEFLVWSFIAPGRELWRIVGLPVLLLCEETGCLEVCSTLMSRLIKTFLLVLLIVSCLYARIAEVELSEMTIAKTTYRRFIATSGSMGFEVEVEDDTCFWISSDEAGENVTDTRELEDVSGQNVGYLILQTKSEDSYHFKFAGTLFALESDSSTTVPTDMEFRYGSNWGQVIDIPATAAGRTWSDSFTYEKSGAESMTGAMGYFYVSAQPSAASSGNYICKINVELTME